MGRQVWTGLDGLRAAGVMAVVVYHASLGWAVNGYAGVDLFFALSGFLITWLLIAERQRTGTIALPAFYMRRFLRLVPALTVTLVIVSLLAVASDGPGVVLRGVLASMVYLSNWWMAIGNEMPLLEHTWTLAIEEHFYIVWPMLVVLGWSRNRARRLTAIFLGAALVAVMAMPWTSQIVPVKVTYLRGFSIVLGSLLAIAMQYRPPGTRVIRWLGPAASVSFLALIAILLVPVALPGQLMSGLVSVPAWLTLIVIAASVATPQVAIIRILSWGPLRWIGKRSYGMYLYHFPVLSLFMHNIELPFPHAVRMGIAILLTLVLTGLSYRFVESPALRLKSRFASDQPALARVPAEPAVTKTLRVDEPAR